MDSHISLSSFFFIPPSPSGDFVMKKNKNTGDRGRGGGGVVWGGVGSGRWWWRTGRWDVVAWSGVVHPSVVKNRKMISLRTIHPPARSAIKPAIYGPYFDIASLY